MSTTPGAQSMTGKVVLVTGGSSGIGEETALGLAKLGAAVTITGRDPKRTSRALERIRTESGNDEIEALLGDFSSLEGVRKIAADFRDRHDRLDVLVNNAGAWFGKYAETVDGFEQTWAVNHLSYFLLTHELMPLLRAAPAARIVNVASDLHARGKIDFSGDGRGRYNSIAAYSRSKLANVLFSNALAKRLKGTVITVNSLHPGAVRTNITHDMRGILKAINRVLGMIFFIPAAEGAKTSIHLAASPEIEGMTGSYYYKCRLAKPCAAAMDASLQEEVWRLSAEQCGIDPAWS